MKRTLILSFVFFVLVLGWWAVLKFRRWQSEGRRMYAHFCGVMHRGSR